MEILRFARLVLDIWLANDETVVAHTDDAYYTICNAFTE